MSTCKTSQPLEGVNCSVSTCEYNCEGKKCVASSISVKPLGSASTSRETDCATFVKKN